MNIGSQIKALRLRKGVTQEEVAQHFNITSQAVSKWECGQSVPDIGMLPGISAYFGVSIDELFALSDEVRMERIQNMIWDVRFLNPADVENERRFLLEKARREPDNGDPYCMLAELELHMAKEHSIRAEEYALEILKRDREKGAGVGSVYLARAMGGDRIDPRHNTHNALINHYKDCLKMYPDDVWVYGALITQLIDDHRLAEARKYCNKMESVHGNGYFVTVHKIKLAIAMGDLSSAREMWKQLDEDYPQDWSVQHWIGDLQTLTGEYAGAKNHYKKSISLLPTPRYCDPMDSLAQACEMDGDIEGAIAARRLELEVSEQDWNCTTGESVDYIYREIARLEKMLQ